MPKRPRPDPAADLKRRSYTGDFRTFPGWGDTMQTTPVAGSNHVDTMTADAIIWNGGKESSKVPRSAPTFKDDEEGLTQAFADVLHEGGSKSFLKHMPQDNEYNFSAEAKDWSKS